LPRTGIILPAIPPCYYCRNNVAFEVKDKGQIS